MKINYGEGKTKFGPGVSIELTGDEIASAVYAYLVAHGVHIGGPRTVSVNGDMCRSGGVYVDPDGFVNAEQGYFSGRGPEEDERRRRASETLSANP